MGTIQELSLTGDEGPGARRGIYNNINSKKKEKEARSVVKIISDRLIHGGEKNV